MRYLLGSLVLLNVADAVISYFLVELGKGSEANPFLLHIIGEPGFIIIKVIGVFLCVLILWDIHRRYPKLAFVSSSCFVALYTGIVLWNSSLFLG